MRSAQTLAAVPPVPVEPVAAPVERAPAPPPAPAADPARAELASLLTIARARVTRGQLLTPRRDSAREYFARAAELAPNDAEVAAVRAELGTALLAAGRTALGNMELDAGRELVAEARRIGANGTAVTRLETDLDAARAAQAAEQHAQWLADAHRHMDEGTLVTAEGESAFGLLERLQTESPDLEGLDAAWGEWRTAALDEARRALTARDWNRTQLHVAALQRAPQGAALAAPLARELSVNRQQEAFLATAAPASDLTLIDRTLPAYPQAAAARALEGWVDLEYVVDTEGVPRDVTVLAADPAGWFEDAAVAAVSRYRYAPFERDGQLYERRVAFRMRFELR
jgi:protein TonB